jgi:GT2 family glycosyltransferase
MTIPEPGGLSEIVTRSRVAGATVPECVQPALSVVIVTYGTGQIVETCIAALVSSLPAIAFEVIVVDNASGDRQGMPTASRLRLTTAGVRLIVSPENLGFGGGNEVGIARSRADILCLLNPDAVVAPGWAEPMLAAVSDPSVGIAAPVLLNPDGSVQEAGQSIDRRAITRPVRTVPDGDVVDVAYSSAACWMLRRDVHARVGGFDPIYHPAYFEDVDMAFRVHAAGLRTVLVTTSCVTHHQGGSTRRRAGPALTQQAVFRRRWAARLSALPG